MSIANHGTCQECGRPSKWRLTRGRCNTCYTRLRRRVGGFGRPRGELENDRRAAESPDPWCAVADALMVLSDKLRSLAGKGLPEPRMTLNIQPFGGHLKTDDETRALVDAVAGALGVEATRNCMHDDVWHYSTRVAGAGHPKVGPVSVQTFGRISDAPPPDQAAAVRDLLAALGVEVDR